MIRRLGQAPACCAHCATGLGECNAVASAAEWTMVQAPALTPASSAPVIGQPAGGFDYTAAGITYGGTPVVSWAQLALGLLALRGSGA